MGRLSLAALPALAFALALAAWAPVGSAGTPEAPEITDAPGDQVILETVPGCAPAAGCQAATRIDINAVWIDEETETQLNVNILLSNVPTGATTATSRYRFHATFDGTEVVSEAVATGGSAPTDAQPTSNVAATAIDGNTLIMTLDKSIYGAATTGGTLTSLFVEGHSLLPGANLEYASDRGPDADFGTDYVIGSGLAGGNGTAGDSDGDGLNDTKEVEQFGNVTAQNGTGDPDGDGLNNTAEFNGGTNATNADTDGDGLNDKEDPFPLDPSKPGAPGNGTGNATDTDADGLPDAWERSNFNSTTAQSGSGDPDSDGLNNTAELAKGTDPNDADTDGDGLNDATDPKPLTAAAAGNDRLEMYAGAPLFAAIATLCLFALARLFP